MNHNEWTKQDQRTHEALRRAHDEVVAAWRRVASSAHGATWTHGPDGTRADFVGQTNRYGLHHLEELSDFLLNLWRKSPEVFCGLLRSHSILDLNAGAALNSVFLAHLARQLVSSPMWISVIEHAPAALELALELAAVLELPATGHLVQKTYESVTSGNPDATDRLIGATLSPHVKVEDGDAIVFAGHAANCNLKHVNSNLQQNLDAQNERVLELVARAVDSSSRVNVLQVDVRASGARKIGFLTSALAASGLPSRARDFFHEGWPTNRTHPDRSKYAALAVLAPAEITEVCFNGTDELLLTVGEIEGMYGGPLPVWSAEDLAALDRLFDAAVAS